VHAARGDDLNVPILDLRAEAHAHRVELDLAAATPEARVAAIAIWRVRMVQEHVSARVFAALVPQMMKAGVAAAYLAEVADMTVQELRHGRLCAGVVLSLGGEPVVELPVLPDVPLHEDAEPLEAVLRNVISISCISETTAVAEFASERERLPPGPLRDVQQQILADEIGHARFGWKLLEEHAPHLDRELRARLGRYLVHALRQRIERAAPLLVATPPPAAIAALGGIDGPAMHALFLDTMAQVVLPGLEACGLDAREAWARASSGPS
jgi:hypothetical protein